MTGTRFEQFPILVEFMEKNEGIAKNLLNSLQFREKTNHLWNDLKDRLNAAGPPEKTVDGWKKVWRDFKYNTKNKVRVNKKSVSGTGGGPCRIKRLSDLEERVNVLLDVRGEIEGLNSNQFGCGTLNSEIATSSNTLITTNNQIQNLDCNFDDQENEEPPTEGKLPQTTQPIHENTMRNQPAKKAQKQCKDTTKTLLKKQLEMQETYYKKQEKYVEKQQSQRREVIRALKEIKNLEEKKLAFEEKKWNAKQIMYLDKMKQKAELLEIKQKEIELRQLELAARKN